jgi:hypothetical protein
VPSPERLLTAPRAGSPRAAIGWKTAGVTPNGEVDRTRVRIGLALITLVVIVALVLLIVVDGVVGKAIMFAVAATAFVRLVLLVRDVRQG